MVYSEFEGPPGYPNNLRLNLHPTPHDLLDHQERLIHSLPRVQTSMQTNLSELDWDKLLEQLRMQPPGLNKQNLLRECMERIWDGPNQPPERINPMVFEPDW